MRRRDYHIDVSIEYFLVFMMAGRAAQQIYCIKSELIHYKRIVVLLLLIKVTLDLLVKQTALVRALIGVGIITFDMSFLNHVLN
jgi:hypothetical protein